MAKVNPDSNLPSGSQPWGRSVDTRILELEKSSSRVDVNQRLITKQLGQKADSVNPTFQGVVTVPGFIRTDNASQGNTSMYLNEGLIWIADLYGEDTDSVRALPFAMQTGTVAVTLTSGATWSGGSAAVTFYLGKFTVAPHVFVVVDAAGTNLPMVAHTQGVTADGFTVRANYYGSSSSTVNVRWFAVQGQRTNAIG